MKKLKWTTEYPDEAGVYLFRVFIDPSRYRYSEHISVFRLEDNQRGLCMPTMSGDLRYRKFIKSYFKNGEFYGPIDTGV